MVGRQHGGARPGSFTARRAPGLRAARCGEERCAVFGSCFDVVSGGACGARCFPVRVLPEAGLQPGRDRPTQSPRQMSVVGDTWPAVAAHRVAAAVACITLTVESVSEDYLYLRPEPQLQPPYVSNGLFLPIAGGSRREKRSRSFPPSTRLDDL